MTKQDSQCTVDELLERLDGSGSDSEWDAVFELRSRLGDQLPDQLLVRYQQAKKWQVRSSCVYHSVRYAGANESAITMALLALKDKSKVVRYRACMLLACSQRKDLLGRLQEEVSELPEETQSDVLAAIDAIESENQDYFVDRDHSGMVTLNIR